MSNRLKNCKEFKQIKEFKHKLTYIAENWSERGTAQSQFVNAFKEELIFPDIQTSSQHLKQWAVVYTEDPSTREKIIMYPVQRSLLLVFYLGYSAIQ